MAAEITQRIHQAARYGLYYAGLGSNPRRRITAEPVGYKALREKYRQQVDSARIAPAFTYQPPSDYEMGQIHKTELQIINCLHNLFLQQFATLYCKRGFDLDEILDAHEKGDWVQPVRKAAEKLVAVAGGDDTGRIFLSHERKPHEVTEVPIPLTGKEILRWMVGLATVGDEKDDPSTRVTKGIMAASERGEICGKTYQELGLLSNKEYGALIETTAIKLLLLSDPSVINIFGLFADVAGKLGGNIWLQKIIAKTPVAPKEKVEAEWRRFKQMPLGE